MTTFAIITLIATSTVFSTLLTIIVPRVLDKKSIKAKALSEELDAERKLLNHYKGLLDDAIKELGKSQEELNRSKRTIDELTKTVERLSKKVEDLTKELQQFRQLNRSKNQHES